MALGAGTRFGPYEITAAIGAGGMGVVYRARDTRLNRDVAIKALPEAFAADPHRLARFEREAQTLAALNHPHIAQIHGVIGPAESAPHALVMEFVDGEDLAARLTRGPIPLDDSLSIARQIAEALEAAHERGVIHRDLKPANVKITPEGVVKVLDFGLAKALHAEGAGSLPADLANSPTSTSPAITGMGIILGTAAYMAPEQAKGKPVDRRADIWAFGVILYEMLTGRLPYTGETVTETIAHVITQPPNFEALAPGTPTQIHRILRRCLEKDPRNRFHSAGDVRIEIDEYVASPGEAALTTAPAARSRSLRWLWPLIAVCAVVVGLLISRPWERRGETLPSMRLDVRIDDTVQLHVDNNMDSAIVQISPDGQTLAYLGLLDAVRRLYVRGLESTESTPLTGTEGATSHFFSPDGRWIAFFSQGYLKKVAVSGGAPVSIAPAADGRGGTWGPNDVIVFTPAPTSGLFRVAASGGTPEQLTTPAAHERTHRWPAFLPDGKTVLFITQQQTGAYEDGSIEAVNVETRERKVIFRGGTFPRYLSPGYLTYVRESTLFAVPFDVKRLSTHGTPQPILSQVMASHGVGASIGDGAAQVAFSESGTAVVLTGAASGTKSELVITTRAGVQTFAYSERREYRCPRFSPDNTRIAVQVAEGTGSHLYVLDVTRAALSKITFEGMNGAPVWSPDGRRLAFLSDRVGGLNLFTTRSDGGGETVGITKSTGVVVPTSFHPDGNLVVGMEQNPGSDPSMNMNLIVVSLNEKKVAPFLSTSAGELLPAFSPDGKWIAYQSDQTGIPEVYVRPYPGPGGTWQVSRGGGGMPYWTKNGREIVYLGGEALNQFFAVEITAAGDAIMAGTPVRLFEHPVAHPPEAWWYSVSADGDRFAILKADESARAAGATHFTMFTNFPETVRRAVAR